MKNKIFKILSIVLTLCLILSVCNIVLYAESAPKTVTYFVDSTNGLAENDGLTTTTALPTVADAVAKAEGFVAGDNIIVNVMGQTANTGDLTTEYSATLTVQSADANTKTTLVGRGAEVPSYINGPTIFKNVILKTADGDATRIYNLGFDVTYESDVEFPSINFIAANGYNNLTSNKYTLSGQTMTFNNAITSGLQIYIPNIGHYNGTKYTGDVNLIVNNEASQPYIRACASGDVTYQKNLNYFIKNATSFAQAATTNINLAGAFQVVINSAVTVSATDRTNLDNIGALATGGYYYVTVSDDVIDALSLTETAGKYAVADDFNVVAVNTETLEKVYSEDGYITLPEAGEWGISEYFPPIKRNYFVDSVNGSDENDGLTVETPVTTVAAAVAKATDLGANDTAIVNIISTTAPVGTFAAEYTHKLVVQSLSSESIATVTADSSGFVKGPTVFKNINLGMNDSSDTDKRMYLQGYSVTFEEGVTTAKPQIVYNGYNTYITNTSQKVVLNNVFTGSVKAGNDGHSNGLKYTGDVDLVVDNASSTPSINHNADYGGEVTYQANLNYFIKNAKSVEFGTVTQNAVILNAALQVVVNKNTSVSDTAKTNIDGIGASANGGYFYLTVDGADYINLTKTAGVYNIAENYTAVAVNKETLQEVSSDEKGELVLSQGEWDVTVIKAPIAKDYYVMNGGTGDGRTIDNPAATVYDVIAYVNQDLQKGDTANINIMNSSNWNDGAGTLVKGDTTNITAFAADGGVLPTYEATLVIQGYSTDDSDVYLAFSHKIRANDDSSPVTLSGPTVFRNIRIIGMRDAYDPLQFNGNNVTFEETVKYGIPAFNNDGTWSGTFTDYPSINFKMGRSDFNWHDYNNDMTVTFKNAISKAYSCGIFLPSQSYEAFRQYGDFNLVIDNASANPEIYWGSNHGSGVAHFYKNVNIYVKSAASVANINQKDAFNVHGALQQIINSNTEYTGEISEFSNVTVEGGIWKIINASVDKELLEFTSAAGKYKVKDGYQAVATNTAGTVKTSEDGLLELEAGEWNVTAREQQTTSRSEYINYRRDLSNTYSKLVNGKKLNVVYFGGSVTNGYGGPDFDSDTYSWRAKIGNWIQSTFPNATVNNINKACGESGTFLGSYRLNRDVLSCEPDLLFLEYSINDKYDYATYERASMQYETIVRQVKEKYPTCDIVTILVTDSGVVNDARKENGSNLHTAAKAHEDVAAHYNIPTLHVGRYLADSLPENWTFENDWKGTIAYDTVHLLEKGNDIYLEVIKEYMNNCLVYGEYDAEYPTEPEGLPEMINDKLLNGNITFIQPSAELIARSEELGGSGFAYNSANYTINGYTGIFTVDNTATDPMLALEFNGTELIALMHNYPSGSQFSMKIDDGEWQLVDYYHMNPQTFVTGLEAGDHTVYFKPVFTDSKTWQWIGGIYSRDDSQATLKGTGPITKAYYVKNGGTGDGRTAENPAPTVDALIPYINADGLNEDDTANIYIIQRDDWNVIPEGKIGTSSSVGEDIGNGFTNSNGNIVQPHYMTSWSEMGGELATAHTAKIVIKSYDSNNKSYLAMSQYLGQNANVTLAGPTVFDDVILVYTRNTADTRVASNYYDLTFTNKFSSGYVNCSEYSAAHTWDGKVYACNIRSEFAAKASTADSKVTVNSAINRFFIAHDFFGNYTMQHDMEIEVNNQSDFTFYWGSSHSSGCTTTLNGNVNFNIKSAGTISNSVGFNSTNKSAVIINGALQYIYSESVTLTNKPGDLLYQVDETTQKGVIVNGDSWFIKNTTGFADVISYTSKPGTYTIDERYQITAKNDDNGATVESEDGKLVLAAGNWTISGQKIPLTKEYYVKNGGTGDGRTAQTPAPTVYDVIEAVNEDLVAGDIANINIMQRDDYNAVTGMSTGTVHNYTTWTTAEQGAIPAHAAKIVLKAYDPEITTYLASCDKYWTQMYFVFRGPTEIQDICLVDTRGNYDGTTIGANNAKITADTSYGVLQANSSVVIFKARDISLMSTASGNQTVEFYNSSEMKLYTGASAYNVGTRTGNVNIIIDNKLDTNRPTIAWGAVHSSSDFTHSGNINIDVRNAYSVTHSLVSHTNDVGKTTINGAVQFMAKSDVVVNNAPTDYSENVTITGGYWDLRINSDIDGALSFTDTAGTFVVKDGYTATAVDTNGNKTGSVDGVLTVLEGSYTVYISDTFTNFGTEIEIHKSCELDVSTVAHEKKENKLFVGWKNAASDEYVAQIANYSAGDVLKAVYVDYNANTDFYYEEAMTTEDTGLRFIFSKNKTFYSNLPEVLDIGVIVLPTDDGGYYDIFLDKPVVKTWNWDTTTGYGFTPNATGNTPTKVKHLNVLEETDSTVKYTVCITNLAESKYAAYYNAKGYIKYKDHNGIENVLYTEQAQSSLYKASAEAIEKRDVDNNVITVAKASFDAQMADYKANKELKYGSGEQDDVYNIYSYNGLNIRDLVIDTGIDGFTETNICFITDPHFNYINEKDTTEGLATTLSSYRGRSWARDGWSISPSIKAMDFANSFDYTVMGGDAVDYVSYGGLAITNRVFTQRSVNNNLAMVMGNHEGDELSQPDMSMSNILSLEERFAFCQTGWSNDVYYTSSILNDKVMVIGLDNSRVKYWDSQLEPLQRDLAYARENGLIVLIFQHIAMLTMNENETSYKYGNTHITNYFGNEADGTATITKDMTSYTGYLGHANSDETTLAVCKLIRQNHDIIKGVFHGHDHCNMYTEIVGLDADGNPTDARIPQHGVAGIHYSAAMAITLK